MSSSVQTSDSSPTKVAIVTGAAQGIGQAVALRLASDGFNVSLNDIPSKQAQLDEVVQEIKKLGKQALALPGDVSKEDHVKALVEKTVEVFGRVDVMVANAGVAWGGDSILEAEIDKWESLFDINIRGVILCYKHAAKQMVKQGFGGRIIGASSVCGLRGYAGLGAYCVSKASVRSLTQTVSLELAPYNITVNAYAPGVIETAMTSHPDDEQYGGPTARLKLLMKIPEAKVGQPSVVASLVSYLASEDAEFVTGQTISMNGGIVLH